MRTRLCTKEEFIYLLDPRGFVQSASDENYQVFVVLGEAEDQDILPAAERAQMSAHYSERHQGWVIQL